MNADGTGEATPDQIDRLLRSLFRRWATVTSRRAKVDLRDLLHRHHGMGATSDEWHWNVDAPELSRGPADHFHKMGMVFGLDADGCPHAITFATISTRRGPNGR